MTRRTSKSNDSPPGSETRSTEETTNSPDPKLDSIRSILFASEQARIEALEEETSSLNRQTQTDLDQLQNQIDTLQTLLENVRSDATKEKERADQTQSELDQLREQLIIESEALFPRFVANLSVLISGAVQASREKMVDALGPVMGDAIRVQIQDSREEMIEALFPVILDTVQRAISEFARTLQRNIDARLKTNINPGGFLRTFYARIRGIPESELILRDSLPFNIEEIFLIQHGTGLLMAQKESEDGDGLDSDLVSGMLTAIRDFVHDSFGGGELGEELDEIQYGDEKIIIQSGQFVYIAAVVKGVEPEGFRTQLRLLIHQLHRDYRHQLRDYVGDPAGLPDLDSELSGLMEGFPTPEVVPPKPLSRNQRIILIGMGLAGVLALACACFYLQFTIALWPVAFGDTPSATMTAVPIVTETSRPSATATQSATPSPTPSMTPSPIPSSTPSQTPSPTATDRPTLTNTPLPEASPEPTATALSPVTLAPVWVRELPELGSARILTIVAGTPVTILSQFDSWVEVEWRSAAGSQSGWIPLFWITLPEPIPAELITPVAGN